jgi:hypothetical protein
MCKYAETAALVAVMESDLPRAQELLGDMLQGELSEFARQLTLLRELAYAAYAAYVTKDNEQRVVTDVIVTVDVTP